MPDYRNPALWNRLIDVITSTPAFREMFLRRLRTLMDQYLNTSDTPANQRYFDSRIEYWKTALAPDAALDKAKWPIWGANQTLAQALDLIKNIYLPGRRTHLFTNHSVLTPDYPNNAGIPLAQIDSPALPFGTIEANPVSGNQDEEFFQILNPESNAVDISGWTVKGGVDFTFKPGTVIPAGGSLYVARNVRAFRNRAVSPKGDEGLFVQGNFQGQLSARGETLELYDGLGRLLTTTNYPADPSPAQQFLRVTEIMYHPSPLVGNTNSAEEFEYLELRNISTDTTLDLSGLRLADGLEFDFTGSAVTSLAPGARVLVVKNPDAFNERYGAGLPVAGQYTGTLDNNGERLQLLDGSGEEILDFSYNDNWYPATDGEGFSLVVVNEQAEPDAWNNRTNWRPSGSPDGSPGTAESASPGIPPILINEVMTASTPPNLDAVELFNPTSESVDVGGWFLSDDLNTPRKFRIPDSTVIDPGGYQLFTEMDFNPGGTGFALGSDGDEVWLFSGAGASNLTGYVQGYRFGAADRDVSFGHYLNSQSDEFFVAQSVPTLPGSNAPPRVGPVVISEIMYHPVAAEQLKLHSPIGQTLDYLVATELSEDQFEYVEVHNITSTNVPLFDPAAPPNTWRLNQAVDFDFPPNMILAPSNSLLVVGFDPAVDTQALELFRAAYGLDTNTLILGPWKGRLDNAGETIELEKPQSSLGTNVPFVLVEAVSYQDTAPWPTTTDGNGLSLHRRSLTSFGSDPTNWVAAAPTPGMAIPAGNAPAIVTNPSNQSVAAYGTATLTVEATGAPPLQYQWQLNSLPLLRETNATLTLPQVKPNQAGNYAVLVFNGAGAVLSVSATLEVTRGPVIYTQPADQSANPGGSVTFSVFALGTGPLTYQWRFNGVDIPGATGSDLTVDSLGSSDSGWYSVQVSDDNGTVISQAARLTVLIKPVVLEHPQSQTVLQGDDVRLRVVLNSDASVPIEYRWRRGTTTVATINVESNECVLTLTNVQPTDAGSFTVFITNPAGLTFVPLFSLTVLADFDGDHLPDVWEAQYGFNTNTVNDASNDTDGDGMNNRAEYIAGTNPTNALSYLEIDTLTVGGSAVLTFIAVSNRNYVVEAANSLDGTWQSLTNVPAQTTNRVFEATDEFGNTNRFYRLVIPAPQ